MARILVIEDNAANLELMSYLLQAFGHAVITATDGEQGEAIARDRLPALILCDLHLPGIDGFEVARRLKKAPPCSGIPLVAVTAFAMVGDRDKILTQGFDGYIAKPIDPETFVEQVETFLGGIGSRGSSQTQLTASSSTDAYDSSRHTRGALILCLDDSPVNLNLLRSMLEPCGYQVATADTVQEALTAARENPPDLILSDMHMPHENGYDFLRALKADAELAGIPLIFITSSIVRTPDLKMGLDLGAYKFISRPVEPEVVLAEIAECLQTHRAAKS